MNTRASRYGNGARIAYHLTQAALPRYSHPNRPHHVTVPQVAACVRLLVSRDLRYRAVEAWLLTTDQVRQAVDLPTVPDHPTVQRMHDGAPGGRCADEESAAGCTGDRRSVRGC